MRAQFQLAFAQMLVLCLCCAPTSAGAEPAHAAPTQAEPVVDERPPDDGRSGRDIYQCVLDNRFDSYVQHSTLLSGDRGGSTPNPAAGNRRHR